MDTWTVLGICVLGPIFLCYTKCDGVYAKAGGIKCYCTSEECETTDHVCTSTLGKCFSQLSFNTDEEDLHGCTEQLGVDMRTSCLQNGQGDIISTKKDSSFALMCCTGNWCNYLDSKDSPMSADIVYGSENQSGSADQSSNSVSKNGADPSASGKDFRGTNQGQDRAMSGPDSDHRDYHPEVYYSSRELWFKAAVIAVPIAGGFILIMLVFLAVRMLRHDNRMHREMKHNQSLAKAQLYVADHFYPAPPSGNNIGHSNSGSYSTSGGRSSNGTDISNRCSTHLVGEAPPGEYYECNCGYIHHHPNNLQYYQLLQQQQMAAAGRNSSTDCCSSQQKEQDGKGAGGEIVCQNCGNKHYQLSLVCPCSSCSNNALFHHIPHYMRTSCTVPNELTSASRLASVHRGGIEAHKLKTAVSSLDAVPPAPLPPYNHIQQPNNSSLSHPQESCGKYNSCVYVNEQKQPSLSSHTSNPQSGFQTFFPNSATHPLPPGSSSLHQSNSDNTKFSNNTKEVVCKAGFTQQTAGSQLNAQQSHHKNSCHHNHNNHHRHQKQPCEGQQQLLSTKPSKQKDEETVTPRLLLDNEDEYDSEAAQKLLLSSHKDELLMEDDEKKLLLLKSNN